MLPLIDMANHSYHPNAKLSVERPAEGRGRGTSLTMATTKAIEQGEPILISYGALPNDFLLLDHGFIVPNNPYDTVQLKFDRSLIEVSAWSLSFFLRVVVAEYFLYC